MPNLSIADRLIAEAQSFNIFGAANVRGVDFQRMLCSKFEAWRSNKSMQFTGDELSLLKPTIAQYLVKDKMEKLMEYPAYSDSGLDLASRVKKRTMHCLMVAKTLAAAGSFNCEIANVVLCLALRNMVTVPLEFINFSGVRDDSHDSTHSFITLGCTAEDARLSLQKAMFSQRLGDELTAEEKAEFAEYVVCDAYHREAYPLTLALANADQRLARYDDISHVELPGARRFLYIKNPAALYEGDLDIRKLCDEVFEQRDNPGLKNRVNDIFREVLLRPFTNATEELVLPEKALRRAASQGDSMYIRWIYDTFHVDINAQDDNPEKHFTALHWAVQEKHCECARFLLELGADPHIEDAKGVSAVQLMQESDDSDIHALSATLTGMHMR